MAVLERPELEASPLADLHAIADQIGLDGFRRLRKADLVDAILGEKSDSSKSTENGSDDGDEEPRPRRRRSPRSRRPAGSAAKDETAEEAEEKSDADSTDADDSSSRTSTSGARRGRGGRSARGGAGRSSATRSSSASDDGDAPDAGDSESTGRIAAGVVEVLGNGSAFLRVDPPEPSDEDVYISAAQVRRCELVSGDRVTGPVRTPRRSERYPSLVRIDTINGTSADAVSDGGRYEDLPVSWPSERLALDSKDATLEAIEWLTPLGLGSRAVIVGARHAGKSETIKRLLVALNGRENLELSVVLTGARPEEIAQWQEAPLAPVASLSFAASSDSQSQAIERAIDAAKRVAARGGNALVLIDGLDGLSAHAARKALSAARNLREGGSLTIIATASQPLGGETTVIALKSTGRVPIVDLVNSGTLRPELLVGHDGAEAIAKARTEAAE
ncbi:MAG TPA: Rho termination factor N-terminal domain-containing protein [Solirubrobacteraceae bacterium]|nr:Rho termination factor N-terminal domain-containing protein [Solirubrobacteraceae bacterium]